MRRALAPVLACSAAAILAGCGSSASPSAAPPGTASTNTTRLRVDTTPRYGLPSPAAPVRSGLVEIAYRNIAIAPDTLRVRVGSTVRWTNYDAVEHNVTSTAGPAHLASHNFAEGATYEVTLTRPGIINYLCTIHPTSMNGTIEVLR
jgi:plastocyanin